MAASSGARYPDGSSLYPPRTGLPLGRMAAVRSWFAGMTGSDRAGFTLISPNLSSPPTKSPLHLNGLPTPRSDSPVRTGSADRPRSRWFTVAALAGVALLAVWVDRRLVRRAQDYSLREWMDRKVDPSMGSQRSDVASLRGVCDQSTLELGTSPAEIGTIDVGMDRLMSQAQCDAVFPALYKELDRSVRYFEKHGLVNRRKLGAPRSQRLSPRLCAEGGERQTR